jgi:hypothetical protein
MNYSLASVTLLVVVAGCTATPQSKESTPPVPAPPPKSELTVTRYSERPMSEFQTQVMNAATKLSFSCRYFRRLYGRWPKDIAEIKAKTEGIDFGVFLDKASVTPLPDDSALIQIFDGTNMRSTKAVPVAFTITEEERAASQKPDYKIKL